MTMTGTLRVISISHDECALSDHESNDCKTQAKETRHDIHCEIKQLDGSPPTTYSGLSPKPRFTFTASEQFARELRVGDEISLTMYRQPPPRNTIPG